MIQEQKNKIIVDKETRGGYGKLGGVSDEYLTKMGKRYISYVRILFLYCIYLSNASSEDKDIIIRTLLPEEPFETKTTRRCHAASHRA